MIKYLKRALIRIMKCHVISVLFRLRGEASCIYVHIYYKYPTQFTWTIGAGFEVMYIELEEEVSLNI